MTPRLHNGPHITPIRTPIGEARLESGILWHVIDPTTRVHEEQARKTVVTLAELISRAGVKCLPAVVDMRGVAFADRAARKVFANDVSFESATALIVESSVSSALGNAYLRMSRPSRPTKLFTSTAKARDWALGYLPVD
ncbi:MAG: hypothetical protein OES13_03325 [Acidimicrobiia bacterium]|nr:hypothetical protein [Acidimicrobiia bacterium]